MTVYLLNARVTPVETPSILIQKKVTQAEARALLENGFVSAIGHQATSQVLETLMGIPIPTQRIEVLAKPGDILVHFTLRGRLPEGKVLTVSEIEAVGYDFYVTEVHSQLMCKYCGERL